MDSPGRQHLQPVCGIFAACLSLSVFLNATEPIISYRGDGSDLQAVFDAVPEHALVVCNRRKLLFLENSLILRKPVTLRELHAQLPEAAGNMPLIVVKAPGVILADLELYGNRGSVEPKDRASLIAVRAGDFTAVRCVFYDSSGDGIEVCPADSGPGHDIMGVTIRQITAYRMGGNAIFISGGGSGSCVRDVTIEDLILRRGYQQGAVEVSDGADAVTMKGISAANALYALEIQNRGSDSLPNTDITVENVKATECTHIVRVTGGEGNRDEGLTLRHLRGISCTTPVRITNTRRLVIGDLAVYRHRSSASAPIVLQGCEDVSILQTKVQTRYAADPPVMTDTCHDVRMEDIQRLSPDAKPER